MGPKGADKASQQPPLLAMLYSLVVICL